MIFETDFRGKHLPPAALSYPVTQMISSLLNMEVHSGDICCYLFPFLLSPGYKTIPSLSQTDSRNGCSWLSDLNALFWNEWHFYASLQPRATHWGELNSSSSCSSFSTLLAMKDSPRHKAPELPHIRINSCTEPKVNLNSVLQSRVLVRRPVPLRNYLALYLHAILPKIGTGWCFC